MATALLLQEEFYPVVVLDVTEFLPKSTVIPAGQASFSLQTPPGSSHTQTLFKITPGRCRDFFSIYY